MTGTQATMVISRPTSRRFDEEPQNARVLAEIVGCTKFSAGNPDRARGCGAQSGDTWPAPEKRQISSTVQRNSEETLIVATTSSGGGAGDITHRVLACKSGSDRCELLASIDTNDGPAPALSKTGDGVALMVNQGDYLAGFRNFSREVGSLQPGELYLQYRVDSKGTELQ